MKLPRPTLAQAFVGSFLLLALALAAVLVSFYVGSRRALLVASERVMAEASARVADAIADHLGEAERAIDAIAEQARRGLADVEDERSVAHALANELAGRPALTNVTLTHAHVSGWYAGAVAGQHDDGDPIVAREGRWQVAVARDGGRLATEVLHAHGDVDPTTHATFVTPAGREHRGQALWSDLWRPSAGGARVVTVQKALWSQSAGTVAVLRVTIAGDRIDELVRTVAMAGHVVFVADDQGRLVSRLSPEDPLVEGDEGVRVAPATAPPAVAAALAAPLWRMTESAAVQTVLSVGGERVLVSASAFPDARTQDWRIGIVAPERLYLGDLQRKLRRVLMFVAALVAACVAFAAFIIRATRRDLHRLVDATTQLRRFDFAPSGAPEPAFRDVAAAAESLEQAKTALRALGKYAPVGLVRQLYEARQEPQLGGHVQDVSLVFSDIEGFTTISEALALDVLAAALGRYLEAMTVAVHDAGGIIDKYTGDGIMALWNAPVSCPDHPVRACASVLACVAATERLFASEAWRGQGLPAWRTRFGVHRGDVSVGHFGAPDRMSFTAMGDGVNLASRLEGLNKQYGTRILVSAAVERDARAAFDFRRLDRVAVKGKAEGIDVFELLGPHGSRTEAVERYERALALYFAARFPEALAELADDDADAPTRLLRARCVRFLATKPSPGWNGVFVATEK